MAGASCGFPRGLARGKGRGSRGSPGGTGPADSLDWPQAEEEEPPALELPADIFEADAEAPAYEGDTHVPTWILDASKTPLVVEAASMPPSMGETLPAS